jgi:Ca-activated chloride channel family protein
VLLLTSLALAGPAWERELTPFTEDTSPLVIALELTDSMYGIDQPPTRLARATQKIQDLLTMRRGARTAVVAYAGTAHAVLPLTDDTELIQIYLASLSRDIMPLAGDRPDRALALALDMLSKETAVGTIVFVTDGIDAGHRDTFAAAFDRSRDQLLVLALGSDVGGPVADGGGSAPPVDMGGLNSIVDAAGGWLARATVDESDVEALNRRVNRHLVNAIEGDEELRWRDAGYVLVWPLALLVLAWFRRGWTVQWC